MGAHLGTKSVISLGLRRTFGPALVNAKGTAIKWVCLHGSTSIGTDYIGINKQAG